MRVRCVPAVLLFLVVAVPAFAIPPNLIKGGTFDDLDALSNWTRTSNRVTFDWNGVDALARPTSGSAAVVSNRADGIQQCVQVFATHDYEFGARVQTARGTTRFNVSRMLAYAAMAFYTDPGCKGTKLDEVATERVVLGPSGRFTAIGGVKRAPVGTQSALLTLIADDEDAPSALAAAPVFFDDVFLRDAGGCVPDHKTLCFADGTLRATASIFNSQQKPEAALAVQISPSSGYFYTYSPDDAEFTIKTIDLSGAGEGKWVVIGGMTNLRLEIAVEELARGQRKKFTNPEGHFLSPVVDVFTGN